MKTPDEIAEMIEEAFARELAEITAGRAATTPDGKPASSMKERTELLKAAVEYWDKRRPVAVESGPRYGEALRNGGKT